MVTYLFTISVPAEKYFEILRHTESILKHTVAHCEKYLARREQHLPSLNKDDEWPIKVEKKDLLTKSRRRLVWSDLGTIQYSSVTTKSKNHNKTN